MPAKSEVATCDHGTTRQPRGVKLQKVPDARVPPGMVRESAPSKVLELEKARVASWKPPIDVKVTPGQRGGLPSRTGARN